MPENSPEQLVFGLMVCFISFGTFLALMPYREHSDNTLEVSCQTATFCALLAGIFSGGFYGGIIDSMLLISTMVPVFLTFFLEVGITDYVKETREKRQQERFERMRDDFEKNVKAVQFIIRLQQAWRQRRRRPRGT